MYKHRSTNWESSLVHNAVSISPPLGTISGLSDLAFWSAARHEVARSCLHDLAARPTPESGGCTAPRRWGHGGQSLQHHSLDSGTSMLCIGVARRSLPAAGRGGLECGRAISLDVGGAPEHWPGETCCDTVRFVIYAIRDVRFDHLALRQKSEFWLAPSAVAADGTRSVPATFTQPLSVM